MRKFLLASVATLGTGGLAGAALAQTPPGAPVPTPLSAPAPISGPIGAPTQGQQAWPAAPSPNAYVNNNNNYQAPMLPGALANPTPGTIVVHFNGKVQIDVQGSWTSLDNHLVTATARPADRQCDHRTCRLARWPRDRRRRNDSHCHSSRKQRHRLGEAATAERLTASGASTPAVTAWRPTACAMVRRLKFDRTSPARSAAAAVRAHPATPRWRRCMCGAPSPTSPAITGVSCVPARPTA